MNATGRLVSLGLLGVFLMPTIKLVDGHERTHRRHATCEHHLRHHHSAPAERARVLRRAARRARKDRDAQLARLERERLDQARRSAAASAGDDADGTPIQAAADPFDDDSSMKKRHRKGGTDALPWWLREPPRVDPPGAFMAGLRLHLDGRGARVACESDPLCHFGSGPCHRIPRPREGTISLLPPIQRLAA